MAYTRPLLKLYRDIRVAHRSLPAAHRKLGDAYVRQEFRQHRAAAPEFLSEFQRQWRDYLTQLRRQASRGDVLGRSLSEEEIAALSDEQRHSLANALDDREDHNSATPPK
uniref:Succinate dehydrogenase assembly factor 3 n=1 Tax=Strombidinopsis acuminata TaxID=141414 RepID=A0A7S3X4S6_9SPIT|mmetsp:Transcript_7883/g.10295  ORF Transcript_7883/g.10295 Transcript_7883/m.10295 type:complete len:110 (+) Transcript_7883:31-360(+)